MLNIIYCILEKIICNLEKSNRIRVLIFSIFSYMFTVRKRVEVRVMFREELDVSSGDDWVEISVENHLVGRVKRELEFITALSVVSNWKLLSVAEKIAHLLEPEIRRILLQPWAKNWHQLGKITRRLEENDAQVLIAGLMEPEQPTDMTSYPWSSSAAKDASYARVTA